MNEYSCVNIQFHSIMVLFIIIVYSVIVELGRGEMRRLYLWQM